MATARSWTTCWPPTSRASTSATAPSWTSCVAARAARRALGADVVGLTPHRLPLHRAGAVGANLHIKQLSLISLNAYRALVVLVTRRPGVQPPDGVRRGGVLGRLARVQAFLGDVFTGKSLQQIEDGLGQGMAGRSATRSCAWRSTGAVVFAGEQLSPPPAA
ncbi:MAG: hypothetical protein ACLVKI_09140 [Gordonibacter urolithinfaciens]